MQSKQRGWGPGNGSLRSTHSGEHMTISPGRSARMTFTASARRVLAVSAGKAARTGIRRLGRGNGTAIPGLLTMAIDPSVLAGLIAEIPRGCVLVTGSNGKGTTCRLLAQVMRDAGLRPVLNTEGSNQRSGLATTMVAHSAVTGHLRRDAPQEQSVEELLADPRTLPASAVIERTEYALAGRFATIATIEEVIGSPAALTRS